MGWPGALNAAVRRAGNGLVAYGFGGGDRGGPDLRPVVILRRLMSIGGLVVFIPCFFPGRSVADTGTSTSGFMMPEEGGELPRARMPTGGVGAGDGQKDLRRAPMPTEGVKDGLRRAPMPTGGVEDGGLRRSPMPTGGVEDGLRRAPVPTGNVDADGLQRAPMPSAGVGTAEPPDRPPAGDKRPAGDRPPGASGASALPSPEDRYGDYASTDARLLGVQIGYNGYLRLVVQAIENDSQSTFIGRNDGFRLANARLGLRARRGALSAYVSFDAAAGDRETFNDPNEELRVRPRDALLRYELSSLAHITAGRFKTPFDLGSLEAIAFRTFIDAAVESRGVIPTQGFEVDGLAQGRQLGLMIHRTRVGLSEDAFDLGYALALTNGRTDNFALNDNDRFAAFARLSLYWADLVALNVAGFTDTQTVGELPNLFDEDVRGLEVSAWSAFVGFRLEGQLLFVNREFETSGREDVNSVGGHAQIAYTYWGVTLAYRFALFDPNLDDLEDADQVIEHTVGLGYGLQSTPLSFMLNGTLVQEQDGRRLDNNRLQLLAQFIF